MNKKKLGLVILVVALVAVLGGAFALYDDLSRQVDAGPGLQETKQPAIEENNTPAEEVAQEAKRVLAPDFTVYDGNGQAVNLSDLRGKPVVVNFWASWCSFCKSEMPDFEDAYGEYAGDIHFMMVNQTDGQRETMGIAEEYVTGQGFTFPVYYDTDMDATYTYGIYSIPATYFIDADGYAIAYANGMLDRETLQTGIDMILPQAAE